MNPARHDCFVPVLLFAALFAGEVSATEPAGPDPATVQAAIAEAKERLKLSAEQEASLRPLMEERAEKLKVIREKHGSDTSRRARREMFREAKPVMEDYQAKVRAILDDAQEAEWEKMRAEAKERLKEQYRSGRTPE